jgi:hypothetical protein
VAEDRASEALDHLQAAALELIAAFRAVLDVAEEAVREPQALVDVVVATARAAADVVGAAPRRADPGAASTRSSSDSPRRPSGVEHISIS